MCKTETIYRRLVDDVAPPSIPTRRSSDLRSRKHAFTVRGHTRAAQAAACSPDGQCLASGSLDQTVKLWEDWKSTRLNSRHSQISYAVICWKIKQRITVLWEPYQLPLSLLT